MDPNIVGLVQELVNPLASAEGDTYVNGFWRIQEYKNQEGSHRIVVKLRSYVNYDAFIESKSNVSERITNIVITEEYTISSQASVKTILYNALISQDSFFVDAITFDEDDVELHATGE